MFTAWKIADWERHNTTLTMGQNPSKSGWCFRRFFFIRLLFITHVTHCCYVFSIPLLTSPHISQLQIHSSTERDQIDTRHSCFVTVAKAWGGGGGELHAYVLEFLTVLWNLSLRSLNKYQLLKQTQKYETYVSICSQGLLCYILTLFDWPLITCSVPIYSYPNGTTVWLLSRS